MGALQHWKSRLETRNQGGKSQHMWTRATKRLSTCKAWRQQVVLWVRRLTMLSWTCVTLKKLDRPSFFKYCFVFVSFHPLLLFTDVLAQQLNAVLARTRLNTLNQTWCYINRCTGFDLTEQQRPQKTNESLTLCRQKKKLKVPVWHLVYMVLP